MKRTLRGTKQDGGAKNGRPDFERAARMAEEMDPSLLGTVQDTINKYGSKSQGELLQELKNYKNTGMMDDKSLNDVAQKLMPMLSPEQQRRLFDVMGQLKR